MFYDKEISILENIGHFDENEYWVKGDTTIVKTIECDVQPITKELAYKEYGLNEDVKYRVFCDPDPLLKNGIQVSYLEQFASEPTIFNIISIIPWDDFWVVLLDD